MGRLTVSLLFCIYLSLVCGSLTPQPSYSDAAYGAAGVADNSKRYLNIDNPNPNDFLDTLVFDNLPQPTNIHFCPDGRMFIALKQGIVRTVDTNGELNPTPWVDFSPDVHNAADRGLLSVACDPNFLENRYVYVLYIQNPTYGATGLSADTATQGLIVRYTEVNGVADPASAVHIIGGPTGSANGFVVCSNSHTVGDLVFGKDGTLFASSGDGSHWEWTDDGTDRIAADATCEQYWGTAWDIGAFKSQNLDIMAGKIIRIDPATGNGIGPTNFPNLVPNPYFDTANPASTRSRVWTMGNRNEFRLVVRPDGNVPGPGVLYVADVGYYDWEEINIVRQPGGRYGWPCLSGDNIHNDDYWALPGCTPIMQNPQVGPLIYWNHWTNDWAGFTGNCAAGAVPYTGTRYPARYQGDSTDRAVFIADFGGQWIRVLWVDENDNFKADKGIQWVMGGIGPVCALKADPVSGDLYYVRIDGQIHRIIHPTDASINNPPNAAVFATPMAANVALTGPMTVNFSSDNTVDVDGDKIWIHWDFGDGTHSNDPNPVHTYTTAGVWTVKMTVMDARGATDSKTLTIKSNQAAPVAKITAPANNYIFPKDLNTALTTFIGNATDIDTPDDQLQFHWEIRLIHVNHYHTNAFVSNDRTFQVDLASVVSQLERNTLEVYLTVTDADGNTGQDLIRVRPEGMTNVLPDISFTLTPITGTPTLTVVADSTATVDADVDLLHHTWDWGDGTTYYAYDNLKTVHSYDKPGTYNVVLTVTDPWDTPVVSKAQTVTVTAGEPDNLALYLTFDDMTLSTFNGTTKDCSSNGATGIVPTGVTGDANGVRKSAAVFTAGTAIEVDTNAFNTVNGEFSLYANVKLDPTQNEGWSVVASNKPLWETNYGFELQFVGNGNANILQLWGSGTDTCTSNNLGIKDGNWHQIGVVVNGTECHIYVDGADVTNDGVITPIVGGTDPVRVGNNVLGQNGWYGEIDDLAIYLNTFMYYELQGKVDDLKSCQVTEPSTTTTTGGMSTTGVVGTTTTGGVTTTVSTTGADTNSTTGTETISTTGTEETSTGVSTTGAIPGTTTANQPGSTTGVSAGSTTGTSKSSASTTQFFGWTIVLLLIITLLFN